MIALEQKPLGQLLLDKGLVLPEQLQRALQDQKLSNHEKLLGEVLIEQKICSEDQVTESLAQAYGVPYARISPRIADPRMISILPKEFLEKHQVLPLFLVEGFLTIAVTEPANVFLLEEIQRLSGHTVQVVAATARDIKATLQAYLPNDRVFVIDDLIEDVEPQDFALMEPKAPDAAMLAQAAGESPVLKLINYCIFSAVKERASDIHIEPGENVLRIRYRIDGRLTEKLRPPPQMLAAVASRIKIMSGLDISECRRPQEGGIRVMLQRRPIDLRVVTVPGRYGEKIVIRIVDNQKSPDRLEKLGFSYDTLKALRKMLTLPSGIMLVTGPAGSGKSTTLYAALRDLNQDDLNLSTIEDPVQYNLPGANQFQVNEKNGFSFAAALSAVLRMDPDVVMIGQIQDTETAHLASQAALTGQFVLGAMHTPDAPSAVARLYNLGIEPYLVGATLRGVLAQRLVRKLCTSCRESYTPSQSERRQLEKYSGSFETLFKPKGCERCHQTGYNGRIGMYELLIPNDQLLERISQGINVNDLRELAHKAGMKSLRTDGMEKIKAGITTLDEVLRVTT